MTFYSTGLSQKKKQKQTKNQEKKTRNAKMLNAICCCLAHNVRYDDYKCMDEQMDVWTNGQTDKQTSEYIVEIVDYTPEWMNESMA